MSDVKMTEQEYADKLRAAIRSGLRKLVEECYAAGLEETCVACIHADIKSVMFSIINAYNRPSPNNMNGVTATIAAFMRAEERDGN